MRLLTMAAVLLLAGTAAAQPEPGDTNGVVVLQEGVSREDGPPVPKVTLTRERPGLRRLVVVAGGGLAGAWALPLRCAGASWTLDRIAFEGSGEDGIATFLVPPEAADTALAQGRCRLYVLDQPIAVPADRAGAAWGGGDEKLVPRREILGGTVMWVVDGQTIGVQMGDRVETVRYAGIVVREIPHGRTPAPGTLGPTAVNRSLVAEQSVRLELDQEPRDPVGRLLAYVYVGETMVNAEMVRRGYAVASPVGPNLRHHALLQRIEEDARRARAGLWAMVEEPDAPSELDKGVAPLDEHTCPGSHPIKAVTMIKSKRKIYFPIGSRFLENARTDACYAREVDALLDGYVRAPR